jgi:diguanylate cyclase (GGDEF)-like protein
MANLRVLLADSDNSFRTSAQRALARQGYFVIPAATGGDALAHLDNDEVDVVVADVALPPRDGLDIVRAAKERLPAPPVILLTDSSTIGAAATGVRQGAFDYLIKPFDDFTRLAVLIDRVAGKLSSAETTPDEGAPGLVPGPGAEASARFLAAATAGEDLDVLLTLYARELAQLVHAPHVVVLVMLDSAQLQFSASHGYVDRTEAAQAYRGAGGEDFAWRVVEARDFLWDLSAPMSLANGGREPQEMLGVPLYYAERALGVAIAFAAPPRETFQPATLDALRRLTQQASLTAELARVQALAARRNPSDALTGLLSREHFFDLADREFRRSWRFGEPIAALELDVDDFTRVQRLLGSSGADEVLQQVAAAVQPHVRNIDLVGRLDTDKIGVLLLMGTREHALQIAERLRRAVAEIEPMTPEGPWQMTISIGLTTYPREQCASVHDLFALAAQATRAAKRAGRNRVVAV